MIFNQAHPNGDIVAEYANWDKKRNPDLLLVCGTSLKDDGIKGLVKSFAGQVRELGGQVWIAANGKVVLVNKTKLTAEWDSLFTQIIIGDCDVVLNMVRVGVQAMSAERLKKPITVGSRIKTLVVEPLSGRV
jgi:NAD-dependent SIR2 family protein deacetylase